MARPERITLQNFPQFSCEDRGGWTLPQLKTFARELQLPATGNKGEIVSLIRKCIGFAPMMVAASASTLFVQSPVSFAQPPTLFVQSPVSFAQHPVSFAQPPVSFAQPPVSFAQHPVSFAAPVAPSLKSTEKPTQEFVSKQIPAAEILKKRVQIQLKSCVPINQVAIMTEAHLQLLYSLYDELFLDKRLQQHFGSSSDQMSFEFNRGTRTAGMHKYRTEGTVCMHCISMSRSLFETMTPGQVETSSGIQCTDQLTAFQLTFEHELVHLMITIWAKDEIVVGERRQVHGPLFQALARNIFGHTDFRHSIGRGLTESPEVHVAKVKAYLRPGMKIKVHDTRSKSQVTYTVTKVNISRFEGTNHQDGKSYNVPMVSVILPDESSVEDFDETEQEIVPVTLAKPDLTNVKAYLRQGMTVQVRDSRTKGIIPFEVVKVNISRFRGLNLHDNKQYDVPLEMVIIPN